MTDDTRATGDGDGGDSPTLDQLLSYMATDGGTVDRVREICNPHLDLPLSHDEEAALVEIQGWFEQNQKFCVSSLETGAIGRERYLEVMNSLVEKSMHRYRAILGETRFLSVFGEAGYETDKLIDRETFLGG